MKAWFLVALALPLTANAQSTLLSHFVREADTRQAQFSQIQGKESTSGALIIGANGKLRWEQTRPHPLKVISNGRVAWQVEPDLNQAIKLDARQVSGWAQVFKDPNALQRDYTIAQSGLRVTLTPRNENGVPALLEFSPQGQLARAVFNLNSRDRTEIRFGAWTALKGAKPGLFEFTPTPGMDVLGH